MMKPICFMVMPFGIKDVPTGTAKAPARVDFDRLWDAGIKPALESLGYEPVRADQDVGALIIHEMLERLFFADLVVADMSIPNGNVYYEIGVRHAAKPDGCVLIAAEWSAPLFDVQQMRRLAYPLPEATPTDEQAAAIAKRLEEGIPAMRAGVSPVFQVLPGYPTPSEDRALTMRKDLEQLAAFNQRIRAIELQAVPADAMQQAIDLAAANPAAAQVRLSVAIAIVKTLRDHAGWTPMLSYVDALPPALRDSPVLKEQRALAISKSGSHTDAIAALDSLNQMLGESSERMGLIGGRYKKLAREATAAADKLRYNDLAIEAYERGTRLEVGNFYCPSNLARLYRERGEEEDEGRAVFAQRLTLLMAESAIDKGTADEWVRPTLLGTAFDSANLSAARAAMKKLRIEGPAAWKLESTLDDLQRSVGLMTDPATRAHFEPLLEEVRALARSKK